MSIEGIYIDDSGNPGAKSPSTFLTDSRKSWAAIIIPNKISEELEKIMSIFLTGIKQDYGLDELHFTDIYSNRGVWKKESAEKTMEIFDLMTIIVSKFEIPICPHAGGIGLSEYVQHLAIIDYVCISANLSGRVLEYIENLHEYFKYPCAIKDGAYVLPKSHGYSATMKKSAIDNFNYPNGSFWINKT